MRKKKQNAYASITHRLKRWKQRRTYHQSSCLRFYAHGSRMFTSCRWIHTVVVFSQLWVISCQKYTRCGDVSGSGCHKPLAGLSLCNRATKRSVPRSGEKQCRPLVASCRRRCCCCIVSDKDTLLHCALGRGLVSSAGWMRGSAEARTTGSHMKESKTEIDKNVFFNW